VKKNQACWGVSNCRIQSVIYFSILNPSDICGVSGRTFDSTFGVAIRFFMMPRGHPQGGKKTKNII
jgi:hypothetical protein